MFFMLHLPKMLCFAFICLSTGQLKNLWTKYDEYFGGLDLLLAADVYIVMLIRITMQIT